MIKRFCDICEKQIGRNYVSHRFKPTFYDREHYTNWFAEVMITKKDTSNKGDLCLDCLKRILESEESRSALEADVAVHGNNAIGA